MTYSVKVTDSYCRDCGDEEVYMDVKGEPGLYKVGVSCHSCDHDYGVLEYIPRVGGRSRRQGMGETAEAVCQYFEEAI